MRNALWLLRLDAWRFQQMRADYYAYFAALLKAAGGRLALRDIFANDAARYGPGTVRGRLAARWEAGCHTHGGELAALWSGVAPPQECLLLSTAQAAGAPALARGLQDLADACHLSQRAVRQLTGAMVTVAIAVLILLCTLWAVPMFTAPHLAQVFGSLPAGLLGPRTRALHGLADWLPWGGPLVLIAVAAMLAAGWWSLANFCGPLRAALDGMGPWRMYRDTQAIRFLSMLEVMIRQGGALDARLRLALSMQSQYATPWLRRHIDQMLCRVEQGLIGPGTFDTGLLDREMLWFMSDMMAAHGLEAGLAQSRLRIEQAWLPRLVRQALLWRWLALLGVLFAMLGLLFWHYGVIDELRRGLMAFYAA